MHGLLQPIVPLNRLACLHELFGFCYPAGHPKAVQHISHHPDIIDELLVGHCGRHHHVGDKLGHRLPREPPALERVEMALQRLVSRIAPSRDLRSGEREPWEFVRVRAGGEYIDLIVLRSSRRSGLRLDTPVAQGLPDLG